MSCFPTHSQNRKVSKTECIIYSGFIMKEIEQLLSYLSNCLCQYSNKNVTWYNAKMTQNPIKFAMECLNVIVYKFKF